jgi:hypothetical protein
MLTAFALTLMGRAHIRSRESQCQTYGEIDALQDPDYVSSMKQQFSHSLEPDIEVEPDEIIGQRAYAVQYEIAKVDGQDKGEVTEEKKENFMIQAMSLLLQKRQYLQHYSRKSSTNPCKKA